MILFNKKFNISELELIAAEIVELIKHKPFVVWLRGDLGAGKTTLTKSLLISFGLPKNTVIQSPTFTYVNEYLINHLYYAHCDFYRCHKNSEISDMIDHRNFFGMFIEWPDVPLDTPKADFIIELENISEFDRQLVLKKPSSQSREDGF